MISLANVCMVFLSNFGAFSICTEKSIRATDVPPDSPAFSQKRGRGWENFLKFV
jgi:hypothetical protein